ncbi:MAG TPA: DUF937 domain-containing protein [Longimicrobium sp.]|jgi:hypothetical protein
MQITDILNQAGGIGAIAQQLGIPETQASAGAAALLPAILGGFKKQAQSSPGGPEGLGGLLGQLGGPSLADQVVSPGPTDAAPGDAVLGQIFGSKEVSRTVAQSASTQTGLDPALLKRMLPLLAMLVAGYMARQGGGAGAVSAGGGALGGLLGGLLGGQGSPASGAQGGGGLGAMLDLNGNGNPLDDILDMAARARGR